MLSDPNLAMSRFPWDFRLGDFRIPPSIFAFLFARSKSSISTNQHGQVYKKVHVRVQLILPPRFENRQSGHANALLIAAAHGLSACRLRVRKKMSRFFEEETSSNTNQIRRPTTKLDSSTAVQFLFLARSRRVQLSLERRLAAGRSTDHSRGRLAVAIGHHRRLPPHFRPPASAPFTFCPNVQ